MYYEMAVAILSQIKCKDFRFIVSRIDAYGNCTLHIEADEADHVTGQLTVMRGRAYFIDFTMTKDDFVRTCFAAVLAWIEHEARKEFSYKGAAIFDPHFGVDEAAERARKYDHANE